MAKIIDGKAIAEAVREEVSRDVARLREKYGQVPGLAVILVGKRKDSLTYVRSKKKACAEVGIKSFDIDFADNVTEEELLNTVLDLNTNPQVHGKSKTLVLESHLKWCLISPWSKDVVFHGQSIAQYFAPSKGILIQLPLPSHINEFRILNAISIEKDVDGLHPLNIGRLAMKGRKPLFAPCTPKGCIELLQRSGVPIAKSRAVVVGRSNLVGLPVALLLNELDATVTIVHSKTPNPESILKDADIIIAAAGQAHLVKGDWIKPGAAVIDVGTNAVDDPSKKLGYRLVGDVLFDEAKEVAGCITPVPGGVGPMTIAMLLRNTVEGAERAFEETSKDK
eukprot:TRINITY_DN4639_c0_g1_i1.p1 TRINITY_DN4639_c0_g1~~TRINITY_DN4639_c0_g1_i1.p1  ORF type:complete len:337 (+),score=66.92 TRINITY_DN4639_c0_g1_i1:153-1163(+)